MKICLLKDIPKTGEKGTIVEVSEGFGRYLINQKEAVLPASVQSHHIQQKIKKEKEISEQDLAKTEEMAMKIDGIEIEITGKSNDAGVFFSAIKEKDIVKKIKLHTGVSLKEEQIKINSPIKEPGEYHITVALKHGLEAECTVVAL